MALSDYQLGRLLMHVSKLPLKTNVLSGLYSHHAFYVVQALALTREDLKNARHARIGEKLCDQFETAVRNAGFRVSGLKNHKDVLIEPFQDVLNQTKVLETLRSDIRAERIPLIARLIEPRF